LSAFAALAEHGATAAAVAPPQLKAPAYRRWSCSGTNRLHRFRSALAAAKARPLGPAVLDLPDPIDPARHLAQRHDHGLVERRGLGSLVELDRELVAHRGLRGVLQSDLEPGSRAGRSPHVSAV